jgi:hypothetical protein
MKRHRLNDLPSADDALIPPAPFVEPGTSVPPESTSVLEHERAAAQKSEGTEAPEHESTVASMPESANAPESESMSMPKHEGTDADPHRSTSTPKHSGPSAPQRSGTKARKRESTAAPKNQSTRAPERESAPEPGRLHVSTYLTPDVVKRVEEVRFRLRVERGQKKISKADVIERALRIGLEDIDELASA